MEYRIEFTNPAHKEFTKLDALMKQRISDEIVGLGKNPRPAGCKALRGYSDTYRIRIGKFRVIYEVKDKVLLVLVLRVAKRDEVYNDY